MPPQEWDEKGKLVDRAVSEWDEKGNPVQRGTGAQGAPAATAAPAAPGGAIGPDNRGLIQRANDWWTRRKGTYSGTLNTPARSPREVAQEVGTGAAVASIPLAGAGLAAAPVATTLGLAGGAVGGYTGSKAGKWAGQQVGAPELGEDIGGVAGGAAGGSMGGKLGGRIASRIGSSKALASVPNRTIGDVMESPSKAPAYVARKLFPKPPEAPAPSAPAPPAPVVGTPTNVPRGNATLPPVPATPQPPMTLGARTAAARPAPPSGVTRVPVPRAPMPGDPNLMGSVPRPELPGMASRGVPGAADQQRLLGEPVIYTPPEGNPPGSFEQLQSRLSERVPQPDQPNLTQRTGGNGYKGPERRGSLRDITGPDPMRNALMNDLRAQAAAGDPTAQQRLQDMMDNPFESGATLGEDIRQARAKGGSQPLQASASAPPDRLAQRVARQRAATIRRVQP